MTDHVKDQLCARIEELEKEKLELNERLDIVQQERDELSEQLKTSLRDYKVMNKFREGAEAERDAMAAHIERCRDVFSEISEYWNGCEGMAAENAAQNAMDLACDMLEELATNTTPKPETQP